LKTSKWSFSAQIIHTLPSEGATVKQANFSGPEGRLNTLGSLDAFIIEQHYPVDGSSYSVTS
jgi:hypothetical protein